MPLRSRPGTLRSRGAVAPPASTIASYVAPQLVDRHVDADVAIRLELDALVAHQRQAAVEKPLFHLECRNPVPQQTADTVGALEHGDEVARPVQLIGRGETGRPGTDDRDALAGAGHRRTRGDPAFVERAIDDRHLDRLDRHRIVVDAEHARALARRGAQPAGELRKVVRGVQPLDGRLPAIAIDEIVPVRNQVPERTSLMAERDAAVHAARRLILERGLGIRQIDLAPVLKTLGNRARRRLLPRDFDEPGDFAHMLRRSRRHQSAENVALCELAILR